MIFFGVNKLIGCLNLLEVPKVSPILSLKIHGIWNDDGRIFAIHFGGATIVGNNQA